MEAYQHRVIDEQTALAEKLKKLSEFIASGDTYLKLAALDQDLLREQCRHMRGYNDVLCRRIERFNGSA